MRIGLHALDAALALAKDGECLEMHASILRSDPKTPELFGRQAADEFRRLPHVTSTRHWQALSASMATSTAETTAASLIGAELRACTARFRDECADGESLLMQVAVPSGMPREAVSRLLAAAQAQSLDIGGFFDASALAVAATGLDGVTLVVELGLHHLTVSRVVAGDGEARLHEVDTREEVGLLALHEAWMQLVSETMVLQSRYDPLHEGESEQRLYDKLLASIPEFGKSDSVVISMPMANGACEVALFLEQLARRASVVTRELDGALRGLRAAGEQVNVLVNHNDFALPGIRPVLERLRRGRIRLMTPQLIVKAVSLQQGDRTAEQIALRRGVASTAAIEIPGGHAATSERTSGRALPTHVFHTGNALPIGTRFEIGSAIENSGLVLAREITGVSRRHCTLQRIDEEMVLIDHSRHGTWLNDERVDGRVAVAPGDRLRIGHPAVEIELIAVGTGDGAPPG